MNKYKMYIHSRASILKLLTDLHDDSAQLYHFAELAQLVREQCLFQSNPIVFQISRSAWSSCNMCAKKVKFSSFIDAFSFEICYLVL